MVWAKKGRGEEFLEGTCMAASVYVSVLEGWSWSLKLVGEWGLLFPYEGILGTLRS